MSTDLDDGPLNEWPSLIELRRRPHVVIGEDEAGHFVWFSTETESELPSTDPAAFARIVEVMKHSWGRLELRERWLTKAQADQLPDEDRRLLNAEVCRYLGHAACPS